jgi:hypothetical protein
MFVLSCLFLSMCMILILQGVTLHRIKPLEKLRDSFFSGGDTRASPHREERRREIVWRFLFVRGDRKATDRP